MAKVTYLTVTEAAPQLGVSYPTLVDRLSRLGEKVSRGKKFRLSVLSKAAKGSLEEERIRETSARADLLELERKEKERDLVPLQECMEMIADRYDPIRSKLISLPSEMSQRTNPTDPLHAHQQLQHWVDGAFGSWKIELERKELLERNTQTRNQSSDNKQS